MSSRINHTGIRSGECIVGVGKQCKGTIMKVKGFYPPSKQWIDKIQDTTLRDEYSTYEFFTNKNIVERRKWLEENAVDNDDLYMEDVELQIKFISINGEFFTKSLDPDTITYLLNGNINDSEGYFNIRDVYELFPRKPGSKAYKHTLIFRPNNWQLLPEESNSSSFNGLYVNMDTLMLEYGDIKTNKNDELYIFKVEGSVKEHLQEFAVLLPSNTNEKLTYEKLLTLCSNYTDISEMEIIKEKIVWFSPSLHKSLIQKLIRTYAMYVTHDKYKWSARSVLLTSVCLLLVHPGSFVPNIQRFVTGKESVFKRTAVSISEDGYIDEPSYLMCLYVCALLSQRNSTWIPSDTIINILLYSAVYALESPKMYKYDWKSFDSNIKEWNPMYFSYMLLSEIRSFESDVKMVGSIAQNDSVADIDNVADTKYSYTMKLVHCIDHHCYTSIAHYMPYSKTSYGDLFNLIWNKVTGINARKKHQRNKFLNMESDTFVKDVRTAQKFTYMEKTLNLKHISPTCNETIKYTYKLDPSWLAGLIGTLEIKIGHTTNLVTLRTDDLLEMNVIRRPRREDKTITDISDEDKLLAIRKAKDLLKAGIILHECHTIKELSSATIFLTQNETSYNIRLINGTILPWLDFINLEYEFHVHEIEEMKSWQDWVEAALTTTGDYVTKYSGEDFEKILLAQPLSVLKRLRMYLTGYKSSIELYHIDRKGDGVNYMVKPEDTAVNHILCAICAIFPAALMKTTSGFQVKCGPLMWILRDYITDLLLTLQGEDCTTVGWNQIKGDSRKLWEHQIESVNQMVDRTNNGSRGHIIWIPMGLGKTLIVMAYIKYMYENKLLPKYIVYTLPPAAIDNIVRELTSYGISYNVIDMRLKSKNTTLMPYHVNLIRHDHMRMNGMDEQLRDKAEEMMFICDEFHLCLSSKTIRTSLALEIARLCYCFISMSGTLLNSHDSVNDLIAWLEMATNFEVTTKNYQVAIGSLIAKRVGLNIIVNREDFHVDMTPEEYDIYKHYVPKKIGGIANNLDMKQATKFCHNICTRSLVNMTMFYINEGEVPFIIASNLKHQSYIKALLQDKGIEHIHLITKDTPLTLTVNDNSTIQAVITTIKQGAGYTLTKCRVMLTSVYYSNQAARDQVESRMVRIGQTSPEVLIITYHTGILSYIHEKYKYTKNITEALKGFAKDVGIVSKDLFNAMESE